MNTKVRRILTGLAVLAGVAMFLILGFAAYIQMFWDRPTIRPVRAMTSPKNAQAVARGEYLYKYSMVCWGCHGTRGGRDPNEPQAGGREFDMRSIGPGFGVVWAPNITPDVETGVGAWSDGELVRAIREGLDRDGNLIFPVMAYQFYHGLSDDDVLAVVAYMRTLAPVRNSIRERQLSFIAKTLLTLGLVAAEPPIEAAVSAPPKGLSVEHGKYLAWHTSGCAECHTPRFPENGQLDRTRLMGGGLFPFPERDFATTAPNLTPDPETGIGKWTEAQFADAVRRGLRPDGTVILPFMPWPIYSRWSDEDVRAIWLYLQSVAPVSHEVPATQLSGAAAAGRGAQRGEGLFNAYCVVCHGEKGTAGPFTTIALAQAARQIDDAALTAFIAEGVPGSIMPAFGRTLTGSQIADIVAHIRTW